MAVEYQLTTSHENWHYLDRRDDSRKMPITAIEGDTLEWVALCIGIKRGIDLHFKRCATSLKSDDSWWFYSPRNAMSEADGVLMTPAEADKFADEVLKNFVPHHARTLT